MRLSAFAPSLSLPSLPRSRRAAAACAALALAATLSRPALVGAQTSGGSSMLGRGSQFIEINAGFGRWLESGAPDGSFGFGAGYTYFPTSVASVGIDVTSDGLGELRDQKGDAPVNLDLTSVLAQGTLHGPAHFLAPYAGIGGGAYFFRSSVAGQSDVRTHWGAMARAGFRVVGWRPVLGIDARYHWVFLDPDEELEFAPGGRYTSFVSTKLTLSWIF